VSEVSPGQRLLKKDFLLAPNPETYGAGTLYNMLSVASLASLALLISLKPKLGKKGDGTQKGG
jgi:hypothetical protein